MVVGVEHAKRGLRDVRFAKQLLSANAYSSSNGGQYPPHLARMICELMRCRSDALVGCVAQWAERRSLAGELTLSCARPAADG